MVIGFCGGTGAGKSTLVEHASECLGMDNSLILAQDQYYKHLPHLSFADRTKINFDHPDAIDFQLMTSDLKSLKQGNVIHCPVYSFAEHQRLDKTITQAPKSFILVEGILIFAHEPLRSLFDYKVYIEADKQIRVARRVQRDVNFRGRTKEDVYNRFENTLHDMHNTFIAPYKEKSNLIIENNGTIHKAKTTLTQWLKTIIDEKIT